MAIRRISTRKPGRIADTDEAILVEFTDGKTVRITKTGLATHNTAEKLRVEAGRQLGRIDPNLHLHFNRDGSVAVAYGAEPEVWPEDE